MKPTCFKKMYAIEKYNRKKGIHDYSFSTIEIGQTIKCIAKNELKNSYVNQKIRRFWAKNLLEKYVYTT